MSVSVEKGSFGGRVLIKLVGKSGFLYTLTFDRVDNTGWCSILEIVPLSDPLLRQIMAFCQIVVMNYREDEL